MLELMPKGQRTSCWATTPQRRFPFAIKLGACCAVPHHATLGRDDHSHECTDSSDRLMVAELAGWMPIEESVEFLEGLVDGESEAVEKAALVA
ncbi:hypothetical protein X766_06205 [Mesorhizobium sp. LSJC255A00]|nr:hypothetical protein X766_06205 [Mesorhizobium sp. LSJC255A00]